MAITFGLYTDSGLTTPFSGTLQLTHYNDLSDNDTDGVLYFGSTTSSRTLRDLTSPGVGSITLDIVDILPQWAASTAYTLGQMVQPLASPDGYRYEVTTAGTSDGSEPTWDTTVGNTTADNSAVWTNDGSKHEETEIKLALTSGGLAGASAGATLTLATTLDSGVGNAIEIHYRITNAVTDVSDNTGYPAIAFQLSAVEEI